MVRCRGRYDRGWYTSHPVANSILSQTYNVAVGDDGHITLPDISLPERIRRAQVFGWTQTGLMRVVYDAAAPKERTFALGLPVPQIAQVVVQLEQVRPRTVRNRWPAGMFRFGDDSALHNIGDEGCPGCWDGYPQHCECGGLVHAVFGEEHWEGYTLTRQCDHCRDGWRVADR